MNKLKNAEELGIVLDMTIRLVVYLTAKSCNSAEIKEVYDSISELLCEINKMEDVSSVINPHKEATLLLRKAFEKQHGN